MSNSTETTPDRAIVAIERQ